MTRQGDFEASGQSELFGKPSNGLQSAPAPDYAKQALHSQLVKLGDMMGDGLHHEPDGKWITKEYRRVARALGYGPARTNNTAAINQAVTARLATLGCPKCGGQLKQTRSGAKRAACVACGAKFQFKAAKSPAAAQA